MTKTPVITFLNDCTIILRCLHCPEQAPIVLTTPGSKVELHAYLRVITQAEFPELVGNIFGRISCCAITSHKNLVACVINVFALPIAITEGQYPAASGLSCFWLLQ